MRVGGCRNRALAALVVVGMLALIAELVGGDDGDPSVAAPTTVTVASAVTTATWPAPASSGAVVTSRRDAVIASVGALVVADPYTAHPYRRAAFGQGWIDADRNCHNTRAEVLMSESTEPVTFNPNGCTVNTGRWIDPWSGFSSTLAADFEIDHTIPLADAWRSGAWQWDDARRRAFANDLTDPDSLNPLRSSINISKGDRTPDQWKPPDQSSWCRYAESWARIKHTWELSVTWRERDALLEMADSCIG